MKFQNTSDPPQQNTTMTKSNTTKPFETNESIELMQIYMWDFEIHQIQHIKNISMAKSKTTQNISPDEHIKEI